ncbi:SDR family oxidoreductase [Mucilaginibacter sp. L196]|uniref:SDR family oxidoreductase n=1 Tax=Mucilaginibacter sp. L196 TaxID=1641870 RepID=UPI00131BA558|nr:SDR family oxidoreductase [Mucilaginibacter sp. L196]
MKNALITAATKGIGRAITIALAKEGINVAVCARGEKDLADLKAELFTINPNMKIFTAATDVSVKAGILKFAADAEKELGAINIIVNNAGIYEPFSILDDGEDTFQKSINTNLAPAYELYRYFGKKMIAAGEGHIFNICSVASLNPVVEAGTYSVTKFALFGLTKVMRLELQAHNVKVTAVIPGSTLTSSWDGVAVDKNVMVLPEDIASAVVNIYKLSPGANVDEIVIKPVNGQV